MKVSCSSAAAYKQLVAEIFGHAAGLSCTNMLRFAGCTVRTLKGFLLNYSLHLLFHKLFYFYIFFNPNPRKTPFKVRRHFVPLVSESSVSGGGEEQNEERKHT